MRGKPLESFHQRGTSSDLHSKITSPSNSLVVWWLRLCAFTAESQGLIPDGGNKVLKTVQHGQKKRRLFQLLGCWRTERTRTKTGSHSGGYSNNPIKRWMVACTWKGSSKVGRCGQITQMGKSVGTKMFKAMLFVSEIN